MATRLHMPVHSWGDSGAPDVTCLLGTKDGQDICVPKVAKQSEGKASILHHLWNVSVASNSFSGQQLPQPF